MVWKEIGRLEATDGGTDWWTCNERVVMDGKVSVWSEPWCLGV